MDSRYRQEYLPFSEGHLRPPRSVRRAKLPVVRAVWEDCERVKVINWTCFSAEITSFARAVSEKNRRNHCYHLSPVHVGRYWIKVHQASVCQSDRRRNDKVNNRSKRYQASLWRNNGVIIPSCVRSGTNKKQCYRRMIWIKLDERMKGVASNISKSVLLTHWLLPGCWGIR